MSCFTTTRAGDITAVAAAVDETAAHHLGSRHTHTLARLSSADDRRSVGDHAEDRDTRNAMHVYASYLPAGLVLMYASSEDPQPPDEPWREDFDGVVCFLDVSGFTALSQKLREDHGDSGAELLNTYVNAYFERLIEGLSDYGGDVIKFAGDALQVVWRSHARANEQPEGLPELVLRASMCCLDMLQHLNEFSPVPGVVLRLHMGIGAGLVSAFCVGGWRRKWEYFISGEPVGQMAVAADEAKCGELVLSPASVALLEQALASMQAAEPSDALQMHTAPVANASGSGCLVLHSLQPLQPTDGRPASRLAVARRAVRKVHLSQPRRPRLESGGGEDRGGGGSGSSDTGTMAAGGGEGGSTTNQPESGASKPPGRYSQLEAAAGSAMRPSSAARKAPAGTLARRRRTVAAAPAGARAQSQREEAEQRDELAQREAAAQRRAMSSTASEVEAAIASATAAAIEAASRAARQQQEEKERARDAAERARAEAEPPPTTPSLPPSLPPPASRQPSGADVEGGARRRGRKKGGDATAAAAPARDRVHMETEEGVAAGAVGARGNASGNARGNARGSMVSSMRPQWRGFRSSQVQPAGGSSGSSRSAVAQTLRSTSDGIDTRRTTGRAVNSSGSIRGSGRGSRNLLRELEFMVTPQMMPALRCFVPSLVEDRAAAGQSGAWVAEHRRLVAVFTRIEGLGATACEVQRTDAAHATVCAVQRGVERHGGSITRLICDDKGVRFLIAFGLPGQAHDDDERRAVLCALSCHAALADI